MLSVSSKLRTPAFFRGPQQIGRTNAQFQLRTLNTDAGVSAVPRRSWLYGPPRAQPSTPPADGAQCPARPTASCKSRSPRRPTRSSTISRIVSRPRPRIRPPRATASRISSRACVPLTRPTCSALTPRTGREPRPVPRPRGARCCARERGRHPALPRRRARRRTSLSAPARLPVHPSIVEPASSPSWRRRTSTPSCSRRCIARRTSTWSRTRCATPRRTARRASSASSRASRARARSGTLARLPRGGRAAG